MYRVACLSVLALCTLAQDTGARLAAVARSSEPAEQDGRGVIAILRRDGLMFPFAAFNKDDWRVAWPIDLTTREIPATLDLVPEDWWGVRPPIQWRAHLVSGEDLALTLERPLLFNIFCARRLGVRTSYQSALPPPPTPIEPFPKDGLAFAGDVPLEPIEAVDKASEEWAALETALVKEFDRVETETLNRVRANDRWTHPIPREGRAALPIRIESWYRSPSDKPGPSGVSAWTVSYVEAVRQYAPRPDDKGCGLETLVSGWLHHQNGVLKKASDLRGKITYCDRVGATYMLPLARVHPKDKTYWIFQLSGWEQEWYDVVEVRPERVRYVIEVGGGRMGCPAPRR